MKLVPIDINFSSWVHFIKLFLKLRAYIFQKISQYFFCFFFVFIDSFLNCLLSMLCFLSDKLGYVCDVFRTVMAISWFYHLKLKESTHFIMVSGYN